MPTGMGDARRHDQNIGKQDRSIETEVADRLQFGLRRFSPSKQRSRKPEAVSHSIFPELLKLDEPIVKSVAGDEAGADGANRGPMIQSVSTPISCNA